MPQFTPGYGFDVVIGINPDSYEVMESADGVAYAFEMDDESRRALAGAVKRALDYPKAVEQIDIELGYIRVQFELARVTGGTAASLTPSDISSQLRQAQEIYNQSETENPDLDGVHFGRRYVGVYEPADVLTADEFAEQNTPDSDQIPDATEPLITCRPHAPDDVRGNDDRHLAYEFTYLLDVEEMYSVNSRNPTAQTFTWDEFARDWLEDALGQQSNWRNLAPVTKIDVWPDHIRVVHNSDALNASPKHLASAIGQRLNRATERRPIRNDPEPGQRAIRQPPLVLDGRGHIAPVPPTDGDGAAEFIERHGMDDVDGTPIQPPEPDLADEVETNESGSGGAFARLNPFGSGA